MCANNLRQIGVIWQMYLQDNNGVFPALSDWYGWGGFDPGNLASEAVPPQGRPLSRYITNNQLYICPLDNRDYAVSGVAGRKVWEAWGTSYGCNPHSASPFVQVSNPAMTIFMGDTTMMMKWSPPWPGYAGNFTWHSRAGWWSNVLFFDSHVAFVRIDLIPASPADDYVWVP